MSNWNKQFVASPQYSCRSWLTPVSYTHLLKHVVILFLKHGNDSRKQWLVNASKRHWGLSTGNFFSDKQYSCNPISNTILFNLLREDDKFQSRIPRTPLDDEEMSARESSVIRKERQLSGNYKHITRNIFCSYNADEFIIYIIL